MTICTPCEISPGELGQALNETTLDTILAERHLAEFLRQAWHVVEPATPLLGGWHLDAIAEHLDAVSRGEIRRLLINVPPRTTKSLSVAVFWPAWQWTWSPSTRWMFSSYALQLSVRDSVRCRRLIESPWYRERWGSVFGLTGDQNVKGRFENDRAGVRIATSVDSGNTGEGAEILVVDDAHNVREAESDVSRQAVLDWWDQVMSTRLNDPRTGAQVIVMQRVHDKDLAGHVLERGGFEHLMLPMEFETKRACVVTRVMDGRAVRTRPDPRKAEGELLCPERMGLEEVAAYKTALGSRGYAGQYQQRPSPAEGNLFKRDWWAYYDPAAMAQAGLRPSFTVVDSAFKDGVATDYSTAATWGSLGGHYFIMDLWRARVEFPELVAALRNIYAKFGVPLYIEDKASGQSAIQVLRRRDGALPAVPALVLPIPPSMGKFARADAATPYVEAGLVHLPRGAGWVQDFVEEHATFPGEYDDQVDTTSGALWVLAGRVEKRGSDGEVRRAVRVS